MRKNLVSYLVASIALAVAVPGLLLAVPEGPMEAGSAAAVEGEVKATTPPEKKPRFLKNGDKIFMGDKLETGATGQVQVLLLDNTVFTLGHSSAITIDEFVYDPENAKNNDGASAVKGALRVVSGKVAQKNLENPPGDPPKGTSGEDTEDALALAEMLDKAERSSET